MPVVTVITGEGGSGGALALAVADRVLMLENAVYSVISPEGCAAILWRDRGRGPARPPARCGSTRRTCCDLGVVDGGGAEPAGGAADRPARDRRAGCGAAVLPSCCRLLGRTCRPDGRLRRAPVPSGSARPRRVRAGAEDRLATCGAR